MEREVPARGLHRSGRVAHPVGHRLPPAADLLPRRVAAPTRRPRRIRSCRRGSARRARSARSRRRRTPGRTTENPFVGTRQLNGLLVLQAMLGNSDLKDEQNVIYTLTEPFEGARAVVRRARPRANVRPYRRARRAARRHRGVRADAVHPRRRERPGAASITAAGTACSSTTSRRPTSAGSASGCRRSPTRSWRTRSAPAATRRRSPTGSSAALKQKIAEGAGAEGL